MWSGNARVSEEIRALPRGRSEQNVLRAVFQNMRANDLGKNPEVHEATVEDTILRAVAFMRANFTTFEPQIDWQYLAALQWRRTV
jgi:hypothetical protein